ncbi:hypothetical protein [Pendulispora albinea]|uniref:Uncharacterized protein n=1 Tax=Pendulispora albinea TaxID=2741071 RepID=A0ABZ2LXD2_9BACT
MDPLTKDKEAPVRLVEKDPLGAGRIGVYTAIGGAIGSVPLPWVPDSIARRVRGALVQDLAARYGLSLTPEARAALAEPDGPEGPRGFFSQAFKFATQKLLVRFVPFGFLPPLRSAAQTFALGHLFHRYLQNARNDRSIRIDLEEARKVRRAIDASVFVAFRVELRPESGGRNKAPEDLRDEVTQFVDGLIIAAASVPDVLVRRLDAAFDECLGHG